MINLVYLQDKIVSNNPYHNVLNEVSPNMPQESIIDCRGDYGEDWSDVMSLERFKKKISKKYDKDVYLLFDNWQCIMYACYLKRVGKLSSPVKLFVYEEGRFIENEMDDKGGFLAPYICKMRDFAFSCLFHDKTFLEDKQNE
jgi:hypothetical protein